MLLELSPPKVFLEPTKNVPSLPLRSFSSSYFSPFFFFLSSFSPLPLLLLVVILKTSFSQKPDGVQRGLVAEIIRRFEAKGYRLVAMKMVRPTKEKAAGHYADLSSKPFFPSLVDYFSSGFFCLFFCCRFGGIEKECFVFVCWC